MVLNRDVTNIRLDLIHNIVLQLNRKAVHHSTLLKYAELKYFSLVNIL